MQFFLFCPSNRPKLKDNKCTETKKTQQMFTSEKLEPLIWIKSYLKDLLSFKVNGSFLN